MNGDGYGQYGKKAQRAHRVAYVEAFGPIPDGLAVCHRCDNPPCIEPSHLFLGTSQENTADCLAKGRHAFGKLTHAQVREIRTDARPHAEVAREYRVSVTTVRRLRSGRSWRFVA